MIDWEDGLILLGVICVVVAVWLAAGVVGLLGLVGAVLIWVGVAVALWRKAR